MVAFMLTGLAIGGASTLRCAQMAFEKGLAAGWYDVAWGFGALLSAMLPQHFTLFSGMLLTAVIFVGIAMIGGLWAGGLANLVNVVVIWLGVTIGMVACCPLPVEQKRSRQTCRKHLT